MGKRIFIAIHYMEIGGAERALLGLLEALAQTEYEVDLFVYSHQGELMSHIPSGIRLLPEHPTYAAIEKPLNLVAKDGFRCIAAARMWAKFSDWLHNRHLMGESAAIQDEIGRATVRVLPSLKHLGEYDVAVSFLMPHYIVRDKVRARKKIAWIHTDYSTIAVNAARELAVWRSYDHIMSISPEVTRAFVQCFPSLAEKIVEQENLLPLELIRRQAMEFDATPEMKEPICLLSIGRFCRQKYFSNAVAIMSELCKLRDDVMWYIIGYGYEESRIRAAIERLGMQEKFIILGKKANPYPYIKACDLYVQPSLYEGKAVTVKEAQFLGKPVAITNYPTARSQVQDGVDGAIIPLDSPADSARALHELLNHPDRLRAMAACAPCRVLEENTLQNFLALL